MCLEGASRAGAGLLASISDSRLRAHYVWVPMLPPDNYDEAERTADRFAEAGATHFWDAERLLARRMAQVLGIGARESIGAAGKDWLAWDVYLAYRRGANALERPDFWMHQRGARAAPGAERMAAAGTRDVETVGAQQRQGRQSSISLACRTPS